jgi:hypothetical protein
MSAVKVFLSKAGKLAGPYTAADLDTMRANGQLERFSWMWMSSAPGWQPVDPMPEPLDPKHLPENLPDLPTEAPPLPQVAPPLPPARKHLKMVDTIEGICHDYRSAVAGRITVVTEFGCELLVDAPEAGTPKFSDHAKVYLNLLNAKNGHMIDVVAHLSSISHSREGWTYRIEWGSTSVPELLRANG